SPQPGIRGHAGHRRGTGRAGRHPGHRRPDRTASAGVRAGARCRGRRDRVGARQARGDPRVRAARPAGVRSGRGAGGGGRDGDAARFAGSVVRARVDLPGCGATGRIGAEEADGLMTDSRQIAGVSAAWEDNAHDWLEWARTPDQDRFYWHFNLPAFARIVPPPGKRTLDLGCGEGRVGRWLAEQGHTVAGIDSSPTLAESAREAGGYDEVVCGDAAALPWPDNEFDAAVAFMTLHDMPRMQQAIREVARVLQPGSPFAVAIVHPLNRPAANLDDYFTEHRVDEEVERRGLRMTFVGLDRPLEA